MNIGTVQEGKSSPLPHAWLYVQHTVGCQGTFQLLFLPELERSAGLMKMSKWEQYHFWSHFLRPKAQRTSRCLLCRRLATSSATE